MTTQDTLRTIARRLQDRADNTTDDTIGRAYAHGLRDAALILTIHADNSTFTTDEHHTIHNHQHMSDITHPLTYGDGTATSEGHPTYDAPTPLRRIHIPGIGDFLTHIPNPATFMTGDDEPFIGQPDH